jgi:hypothetical protein
MLLGSPVTAVLPHYSIARLWKYTSVPYITGILLLVIPICLDQNSFCFPSPYKLSIQLSKFQNLHISTLKKEAAYSSEM